MRRTRSFFSIWKNRWHGLPCSSQWTSCVWNASISFSIVFLSVDRNGSALSMTMASPVSRCASRSEEHTSELQSQSNLVCRLLLEKKKATKKDVFQSNGLYVRVSLNLENKDTNRRHYWVTEYASCRILVSTPSALQTC